MDHNGQLAIPPRKLAALLARAALRVHPLVAHRDAGVENHPDTATINRSWFGLVPEVISRQVETTLIGSIMASQGASETVQDAIANAFALASPLSNRPSRSRLPFARPTPAACDCVRNDAASLILLCDCLVSTDHMLLLYERVLTAITTLPSRIATLLSCPTIATSLLNDRSALDKLGTDSTPVLGSPIHPLLHPIWPALWPDGPPAWFSRESCEALFRQDCSSVPPHAPDNPHMGRGFMNLMDIFGC
jgi:hypothetical protein